MKTVEYKIWQCGSGDLDERNILKEMKIKAD